MKIPKYIQNEIDNHRFLPAPEDGAQLKDFYKYTFRLFEITGDEQKKPRNIEKTKQLAEKIAKWAKRNDAIAEVGEPITVYKSVYHNTWCEYYPTQCIQIGITDPVCKYLEDIMPTDAKNRYIESCSIAFKTHNEEIAINKEKNGYVRAYHDGYGWGATWYANEETSKEKQQEINEIYRQTLRLFPNGVPSIQEYLYKHPETRIGNNEGNISYAGKHYDYWIRLIARKGDYNIYINYYDR